MGKGVDMSRAYKGISCINGCNHSWNKEMVCKGCGIPYDILDKLRRDNKKMDLVAMRELYKNLCNALEKEKAENALLKQALSI